MIWVFFVAGLCVLISPLLPFYWLSVEISEISQKTGDFFTNLF